VFLSGIVKKTGRYNLNPAVKNKIWAQFVFGSDFNDNVTKDAITALGEKFYIFSNIFVDNSLISVHNTP